MRKVKNVEKKANGLARVTPYMSIEWRRFLVNAFFSFHFNYYPLV